mgnify:CR=1 FL=1
MQSINYYQLFSELINHYHETEITIEISVLNEFVKRVKSYNIFCNFDYSDLEEYANLHPTNTNIEACKLVFYPSTEWVRHINHFTSYYGMPENKRIISEIWEEISK